MRAAGGLPEFGDAPGRVDEGGLGWRVGDGYQVWPREHAGHEQQPGAPQVAPGRGRAVDDDGTAGPASLRVEVAEHARQPVAGQRLGAEREVCVEEIAQPWPVWCDQQLPA